MGGISRGLNKGYAVAISVLQENVVFSNECSVWSSDSFPFLPSYTAFCGQKRPYRSVCKKDNLLAKKKKKKKILKTKACSSIQAAHLPHAKSNWSPSQLQQSKTICGSQVSRNIQAEFWQVFLLFIFAGLLIPSLCVTTIVQLVWKHDSWCRNVVISIWGNVGFFH